MKNNDFDFITDKFDSAEQSVPESLSAKSIEAKIRSNSEHETIKFKKKRISFKPIISAAACIALILGVLFAVNPDFTGKNKLTPFKNYDELNERVSTLKMLPVVSEMGCGMFGSQLQRNEDGVEKPCVVKKQGDYIYYAYYNVDTSENRNKVVISKTDENGTNIVSVIDKLAPDSNDEHSDSYEIENLFVYGNRLVVLMEKDNIVLADKNNRDYNAAIIKIFDITDNESPTLITEFEQSGEYLEARMIDGTLYVVSAYKLATDDKNYIVPLMKENGEASPASSKNIAAFENTSSANYAVISTIDVEAGKQSADLKAVLGGSARASFTKDFIYINEYVYGEDWFEPEKEVEAAMKLNLAAGKFEPASEEEVEKYKTDAVHLNRGEMYDSRVYPFGNYFISLGRDANDFKNEIILLDENMNELDSMILENSELRDPGVYIYGNIEYPYFNESDGTIAITAVYPHKTTNAYHYQGAVIFEIKDNKLSVKEKITDTANDISSDVNRAFGCSQIILDGYVYSFVINTEPSLPIEEQFKIYSYKY